MIRAYSLPLILHKVCQALKERQKNTKPPVSKAIGKLNVNNFLFFVTKESKRKPGHNNPILR